MSSDFSLQSDDDFQSALNRAQFNLAAAIFFDDVATAVVAGGIELARAQCGALWLREAEAVNLSVGLGSATGVGAPWICVLSHQLKDGETVVQRRESPVNNDLIAETPLDIPVSLNVLNASRGENSMDENANEAAFSLKKNGQVIAVLQLSWNEIPLAFENRVLDLFGELAALGLTKARLFEQVEIAKREWETTFDGMVDGVLVERVDGTILRANPVAALLFGCDTSHVIGKTQRDLVAELPHFEQLRALAASPGDETGRDVRVGEFRFGAPARIVLETVSSLRLSPASRGRVQPLARVGDRRRVVRILRDITEQRRLEEQFIQSEKLATLGELISGVAHELNNPLTTVTGYAQLLQEDPSLPSHARRQIEHIYEDAARAARIVANLLSFARREETRHEQIDINDLLRHLAEMRTYQLQTENVRLSFEYSNELPAVLGDPHQLQQVFLNIVTNAQQALHEWRGGGTISVETSRVSVGGAPGVQIVFADNGPGIAPDHLRRIFDPFWTTKQDGEGTGLGMSLSLEIVSRHGGRIWAESTLGHGARFYIELPGAKTQIAASSPIPNDEHADVENLKETDAHDENFDESSTRFGAAVDEATDGAQILIVDDEEPVILLMTEVLGLDDHEITPAFNGGEALALLQERDFDLIISDVRMPAVGGPTFFEILQTARPDLLPRVVFVTGDTMSRSTQDFLKQANRPVLAKPFDPDRLRALVRDQLNRNRS